MSSNIEQFTTDQCYLRRSNALRIKSIANLELLPYSLQKSLEFLIKRRQNSGIGVDQNAVNILDQIRQGVQLRPIGVLKATTIKRIRRRDTNYSSKEDDSTDAMLINVLRQRYTAMQSSDDEQDDEQDCELRFCNYSTNETGQHLIYETWQEDESISRPLTVGTNQNMALESRSFGVIRGIFEL